MAQDISIRRGVYDSDYFSGAQVAVYIGDTWIDEITSIAFEITEPRIPLHGYADVTFKDVCRGQVSVQGQLSINFKEAGYLWLVLNRYKTFEGKQAPIAPDPYTTGEFQRVFNIEEKYLSDVIKKKEAAGEDLKDLVNKRALLLKQQKLTGFASTARELGPGPGGQEMLGAESVFEAFENYIWKSSSSTAGDVAQRRVTDIRLNPFDIYITYGDYSGDDRLHHTVQKLQRVYLTSVGKQIVIDGTPIQEQYQLHRT
jgi:hypothetical protein